MTTQHLNWDDSTILLNITRETIHAYLRYGDTPEYTDVPASLTLPCGCFVTISRDGWLRGCIGCFSSDRPLVRAAQEMGISAATRDPRFPPLTLEEFNDTRLEISILSPLKPIRTVEEIIVGTHGIYLEKGACRGVLLPQVAVQYGWDRDTFLSQTCCKAGLQADAWRSGCRIFIFSAQIVTEPD